MAVREGFEPSGGHKWLPPAGERLCFSATHRSFRIMARPEGFEPHAWFVIPIHELRAAKSRFKLVSLRAKQEWR